VFEQASISKADARDLARLDTYIGPETPNPLSIKVLRSTGELPNIRNVLADIMGLTKINE
jgi:hypothetical protein